MSEATETTADVSSELVAEIKADNQRYGRPRALVARRDIPRTVRQMTGRPRNPHEQTIRRWYTKGIAGVKLEIQWIGGEVYTTKEAIISFFEKLTAAKMARHEQADDVGSVDGGSVPSLGRSGKVNLRAARMAQARVLRRLGVDPVKALAEAAEADLFRDHSPEGSESQEESFEVS